MSSDIKKITVVGGWKNVDSESPTPHNVTLDGWVEPKEAIRRAKDEIGGYTNVIHTVEEKKYSFNMEEADEIRNQS